MGSPTARKPPRGGRGSNQYATKGAARVPLKEDSRELAAAVELEQAAWVFAEGTGGEHSEMAPAERRKRRDTDLIRRAAHPNPKERAKLAAQKSCPPDLLSLLADDDNTLVAKAVAANPGCPPETLDRLLEARQKLVAIEVAQNPSSSPETLEKIVQTATRTDYLRCYVAANPACTAEQLTRWVNVDSAKWRFARRDDRQQFQRFVVSNPSCPVDLVEKLVGIRSTGNNIIWKGAVLHPDCPERCLRRMYQYGDSRVRRGVASHPNTPLDLVSRLRWDGSKEVRERAVLAYAERRKTEPEPNLRQTWNRREPKGD